MKTEHSDTVKESETTILLNLADEIDGFFDVFTSRRDHLKLILSMVPKGELINFKEYKAPGVLPSWTFKVPISYLSTKSLGFIRPKAKIVEELGAA